MKSVKVTCLALFLAGLILTLGSMHRVESEAATEAPSSLDLTTNGLVDQATLDDDRAEFEQVEGTSDGIGPLYNSNSCAACHANPITGVESLSTELRAGHLDDSGNFVPATVTLNDGLTTIANRSLINDRAICPGIVMDAAGVAHDFQDTCIQERVPGTENVRTLRRVTNVLGDGYVEAIDDNTLVQMSNNQAAQSGGKIHGLAIRVPVAEANNALRVGRFGWKDQHASLLSFASDAYLNEMGVTNQFNPTEFNNIDGFAEFMRSTKTIPRDLNIATTADSKAGEQIFSAIGCAICHVTSITTAPAGTVINGGMLTIPAALGNKIIHPYSDFLLHDVGTGDGIVQNGGPESQFKVRTAPLWGLRFRNRLMHDTLSLTFGDAILRHSGEAGHVINKYRKLDKNGKNQLLTFLNSL